MNVPQTTITHNGHQSHTVHDPEAWKKARDQAHRNAWMASEPPYLHSLKWQDPELGIEHMTVIRATDVDTLWREVRTVMALIKASKDRAIPVATVLSADSARSKGWCTTHSVQMTLHHNKKGSWWSHKTAEGWCHGK